MKIKAEIIKTPAKKAILEKKIKKIYLAFTAALGEIMDTSELRRVNWKVNGAPTNRMECKLTSVQIRISCRVFTAPMI